jgi:PhnB protein
LDISTYLFFDGNCEEAFKFYEQLLGGKIELMMPHRGTPAEEYCSPEWKDKILHACLRIGKQSLLASDAPPDRAGVPEGFFVSVSVADPEEAERIFAAFAEGGTIKMPMEETFWARRFGMVVDRFRTPWMVNCEKS